MAVIRLGDINKFEDAVARHHAREKLVSLIRIDDLIASRAENQGGDAVVAQTQTAGRCNQLHHRNRSQGGITGIPMAFLLGICWLPRVPFPENGRRYSGEPRPEQHFGTRIARAKVG